MPIEFKPITVENWLDAIKLETAEAQRGFVASNLFSIAQAHFYPTWEPLAIYHDDAMVGFLMYGQDETDGSYWVIRLMIDQAHQGKGYGRAAMQAIIAQLGERADCEAIYISCAPENEVAQRLYESLGFRKTGAIEDGEIVSRLDMAGGGPQATDQGTMAR